MLALVFSFLVFCACLIFRQCNQAALFLTPAVSLRIVLYAIFTASLGVAALPVFSPLAFAAEWAMTPSLKLGYEFNDNYRMTLEPHNNVHGSTVMPRLDLGVQSEVWEIKGIAQATQMRFSGEEGLDRDDKLYSLFSSYRTERNIFTINVSRVDDAVISGELEDPDLGLATVQKLRRTENVQPTWSWSMTERAQIQLGYQLSEVRYTDGQSVGLYDYQWRDATATLSYQMSPRSQFFFTADHSTYRVPVMSPESQTPANPQLFSATLDVDSSTQSFRTGFGYAFSETMQGTLKLGLRKTSREQTVQTCVPIFFGTVFVGYGCSPLENQLLDDSGPTYSGDLQKKFEKYILTASGSREITASGSGTESDTGVLRVKIERPYTARLRGALTTTGSKTRYLTSTTSDDRTQYSIQPSLYWTWTREANMSLDYRYGHLKREVENQAVQSHAVFLKLVYVWPKLSVSR